MNDAIQTTVAEHEYEEQLSHADVLVDELMAERDRLQEENVRLRADLASARLARKASIVTDFVARHAPPREVPEGQCVACGA